MREMTEHEIRSLEERLSELRKSKDPLDHILWILMDPGIGDSGDSEAGARAKAFAIRSTLQETFGILL